VIEGALTELLPALEEAVREYIADLIEDEASHLISEEKLRDEIGEWIEGPHYAADEVSVMCAKLFEELVGWNVLLWADDGGAHLEGEDEESYEVEEGVCVICERRMPLTK
jgi:hypothetical protein